MWSLHEQLARERLRELHVQAAHERRVSRLARARRLQRRAESASRRARLLLASV